jgi:hypothetical protein
LVLQEPSGNDDSEYFSRMSVNQMAMQSIQQHHFPEPWGRGGGLWDKLAIEVMEIATHYGFDEN